MYVLLARVPEQAVVAHPFLQDHWSVKVPDSLPSYPFTTTQSFRGVDLEFVMVTASVSGSSVHLPPSWLEKALASTASLQNTLC